MNTDLLGMNGDLVIGYGQGKDYVEFTGKDCVIKEIRIEHNSDYEDVPIFGGYVEKQLPQKPISVNIEFLIPSNEWSQLYDGNYKPKVSNKKVKDCSVRELLFAARNKLNG